MSIQRYNPNEETRNYTTYYKMEKDSGGDYVLFEDHEVIANASSDRIANMIARVRGETDGDCPFCETVSATGHNQDCPMCRLCQLEANQPQYVARIAELEALNEAHLNNAIEVDQQFIGINKALDDAGVEVPDHDNCYGLAIEGMAKELASLRQRLEKAEKASKAYQDLSTCYRIGKRPSEKLLDQLHALAVESAKEGGANG